MSTYAFLSKDEAKLFAKEDQVYLVKEVFQYQFDNVSGSNTVSLTSNGMISSWMWYFQRNDVNLRNEWSNYTNWEYDYVPKPITLLPTTMKRGPYTINGYGASPLDGSLTMLYGTGDLHAENQKNILLQFGITFDGAVREEMRSSSIYLQDQQYLVSEGYGSTGLDGLYTYNFALKTSPFILQPSGAINLSKFSKIELEFTTITPPLDPDSTYLTICDPELNQQIGVNKAAYKVYTYNYNVYVLEERYNILTFLSGNAGMMNAR